MVDEISQNFKIILNGINDYTEIFEYLSKEWVKIK